MTSAAGRVDVHHHIVPPLYRDALAKVGTTEAGGRDLPDWSPGAALEAMDLLGTATAIVSVSSPGTGFLTDPAAAAEPARQLNAFSASLPQTTPAASGTSPPCPCPMSPPQRPRPGGPWTNWAPTGSPCSPTTRARISARAARTSCGRSSTTAAPSC
ncbi:hypothetical protein AB0N07_00450 [Streptomyces sp. NPDC051172]|uniref:hypothetical protein n=1 Tax=Streptomyces sp. NPDC051172 TaxID=3155796 RepID=UPI003425078B